MAIKVWGEGDWEQTARSWRRVDPVRVAGTWEATGYSERWSMKGSLESMRAKMAELEASPRHRLVAQVTRIDDDRHAQLDVEYTDYRSASEMGAGASADGEAPGETRDMPSSRQSTNITQEPILSHSLGEGLTDTELVALNALVNGAGYYDMITLSGPDPSAEGGVSLYEITIMEALEHCTNPLKEKILRGITSYYCPHSEVTVRYMVAEYPEPRSACEIVKEIPGQKTPNGYNWLRMPSTCEPDGQGQLWVTETYQLSGPGGWDEDIYS